MGGEEEETSGQLFCQLPFSFCLLELSLQFGGGEGRQAAPELRQCLLVGGEDFRLSGPLIDKGNSPY